MTTNEVSSQESSESVDEQRARGEEFTMVVLDGDGGGHINVCNESYDDPTAHIHTVHVEDGNVVGCSCPHATYRDAHCKHQCAVEQRPLVLTSAAASAATTSQQVATDGGTQQATHPDTTDTETDETRPQADHWENAVAYYDDAAVGAGEKRHCQSCGARFEVAMIAATAENNRNWEEFYECQTCGATGSFRFYGATERREWTGHIDYPEDSR